MKKNGKTVIYSGKENLRKNKEKLCNRLTVVVENVRMIYINYHT